VRFREWNPLGEGKLRGRFLFRFLVPEKEGREVYGGWVSERRSVVKGKGVLNEVLRALRDLRESR